MKKVAVFLLSLSILCCFTACLWEKPSEPAEEAGSEEIKPPVIENFSLVCDANVSDDLSDAVLSLKQFLVKKLGASLEINPQNSAAHEIVVGISDALDTNTYVIRSERTDGSVRILVQGNNQRSTLAAVARFQELLESKSWEEMLSLNLTESLDLSYPRTVSFYGDSISSYNGISNFGLYNSTLAGQKVWYDSSKLKKDETWWSVLLASLDATLCVDNAYSGDWTGSDVALNRAKNLHRDTNGKIKNPDTIIVYFGINDVWKRVATPTETTFHQAYQSIISTIKETYPDAQIFCCTLLPGYQYKEARLAPFNQDIRAVAKEEGVDLIDLDQAIGAEFLERLSELTIDAENLHPNAEGMKLMGETVAKEIEKWYYGE